MDSSRAAALQYPPHTHKKLSCSVIAGGFSSLPHVEKEDEFLAEGFMLFRLGHPVARPAFVKKKNFVERIFRSGHNFPCLSEQCLVIQQQQHLSCAQK